MAFWCVLSAVLTLLERGQTEQITVVQSAP